MNNDLKTEEMCENWLIQQKQKLKEYVRKLLLSDQKAH